MIAERDASAPAGRGGDAQKPKSKRKKRKRLEGSKEVDTNAGANVCTYASAKPRKQQPAATVGGESEHAQWNFAAEYNDHFETPLRAYADVSCVMELLAEQLGKSKSDLVVYDPYYCKGSMVSHMSSLGYANVINRNRDFYKDMAAKEIPDFDILVTNPPYSGEHKQRLLTYLQNRRVLKPFALLLPAYTVTKSYWRDFVTFVENKSKKANAGLASSCFMYILPPVSYNYEHPDGTGHKIPPFYSAWLLGGFPNMHSVFESVLSKKKFEPSTGLKRPRTALEMGSGRPDDKPVAVNSIDAIIAAGFVSGEKRPNPKGRKRRKA